MEDPFEDPSYVNEEAIGDTNQESWAEVADQSWYDTIGEVDINAFTTELSAIDEIGKKAKEIDIKIKDVREKTDKVLDNYIEDKKLTSSKLSSLLRQTYGFKTNPEKVADLLNLARDDTHRRCVKISIDKKRVLNEEEISDIYKSRLTVIINEEIDNVVEKYHNDLVELFSDCTGGIKEATFEETLLRLMLDPQNYKCRDLRPDVTCSLLVQETVTGKTEGVIRSAEKRKGERRVSFFDIKTSTKEPESLMEQLNIKYGQIVRQLNNSNIKAEINLVTPSNFIEQVKYATYASDFYMKEHEVSSKLDAIISKYRSFLNLLDNVRVALNIDKVSYTKEKYKPIASKFMFENIPMAVIPGYNDEDKWLNDNFESFDEICELIKENDYQIKDMNFNSTDEKTIRDAFDEMWAKNDQKEQLKIAKPSIPGIIPKTHDTGSMSMIQSIRSGGGICTTLGAELRHIFSLKKYYVKEKKVSLVFVPEKNSIFLKPQKLFEDFKLKGGTLEKMFNVATSRREATEMKTIHSNMADEYSQDVELVLESLSSVEDSPIRLMDGSREDYPVDRCPGQIAESCAKPILDVLLQTRAAKVLRSFESAGKAILHQQNKARKYFYVHDGGSTDMCFVFMPHGPLNLENTQVKFFVITKRPVLMTAERIIDEPFINGRPCTVSQIFSVNQQRVLAMRKCFSIAMSYATVQGVTFEGNIHEKIEYARRSLAVATMLSINTSQDISEILDVSKYLCNASQSLLSNIKNLIVDKFDICVKNKLTCWLLKSLEEWSVTLCNNLMNTVSRQLKLNNEDEEISDDSLGIVGKWPSLYFKLPHKNYKTFQNETSGLFVLREKMLMGGQEMPKQYTRLKSYDLDFEREMNEKGADHIFNNPINKTDLHSKNIINCKLIRFLTREYFKENPIIQDEYYKKLTDKGLTNNIATVCNLNGCVKDIDRRRRKDDLHSTSMRECVEILKQKDAEGVEASILNIAKESYDRDFELIISLKEQRGGTRPITSMSLRNKICMRVWEMMEQTIGEFDDTNIIVPKVIKLQKIRDMCLKVRLAVCEINFKPVKLYDVSREHQLGRTLLRRFVEDAHERLEPGEDSMFDMSKSRTYYFTEDKTKFSETWNMTSFMHYIHENPCYSDGAKRYVSNLVKKMMERKLYYKHKITECEKSDDKGWTARDSKVNDHFRLRHGWAQGFLNHASTNMSSIANWGAHKIFERIVGREVPYKNLVHSDDSCCAVGLRPDELPLYFAIRNKIARLFSLKISLTKSYVSDKYCEIISHFCINGEVFQPYIKQALGMMSDFSYSGPDKDTIDMLNRLKDCYRMGASMSACWALKKIGMDRISGLYLNGPGQHNDPTRIIKESTGLVIDRSMVPLGLFGSPSIDLATLCIVGGSADEKYKLRMLKNTLKIYNQMPIEKQMVANVYRKMFLECFRQKQKNADVAGSTSGLLGGLRLHSGVSKFKNKSRDFIESLSDVEPDKSFPLYMPRTSNKHILEYMRDTCVTRSYTDAVNKMSQDLISTQRRLFMMCRGKCWSFNEVGTTELMGQTERDQIRLNNVNPNLATAKEKIKSIVMSSRQWDDADKALEVKMFEAADKDTLTSSIMGLTSTISCRKVTSKLKSVVVNTPPFYSVSSTNPKSLMRVLMSIFAPEVESQVFSYPMNPIDKLTKYEILKRFEPLIESCTDRKEKMQVAVTIYNIINSEKTRTTPFYCPRVKSKDIPGFIKDLISVTTVPGLQIACTYTESVNVTFNQIIIDTPVRSCLQARVFAMLNDMYYDDKLNINRNSLGISYNNGNDEMKRICASLAFLNYEDDSLILEYCDKNVITEANVLTTHKIDVIDGRPYRHGKMVVEFRRGTSVMKVERIDFLPRHLQPFLRQSKVMDRDKRNQLLKLIEDGRANRSGIYKLETNDLRVSVLNTLFRDYLNYVDKSNAIDLDEDTETQYKYYVYVGPVTNTVTDCMNVFARNKISINKLKPSKFNIPIGKYVANWRRKGTGKGEITKVMLDESSMTFTGLVDGERSRLFAIPPFRNGCDYTSIYLTTKDFLFLLTGDEINAITECKPELFESDTRAIAETSTEKEEEITEINALEALEMIKGTRKLADGMERDVDFVDIDDYPEEDVSAGISNEYDAGIEPAMVHETLDYGLYDDDEEEDVYHDQFNVKIIDGQEYNYTTLTIDSLPTELGGTNTSGDLFDIFGALEQEGEIIAEENARVALIDSNLYDARFFMMITPAERMVSEPKYRTGLEIRNYKKYFNVSKFIITSTTCETVNLDAFIAGQRHAFRNRLGPYREFSNLSIKEIRDIEEDVRFSVATYLSKHGKWFIRNFLMGAFTTNYYYRSSKIGSNEIYLKKTELIHTLRSEDYFNTREFKMWDMNEGQTPRVEDDEYDAF